MRDVAARLLSSGRAYADAELERQKIRAELIGAGARTIALLVTVALILLFGTLVTLMLGLVIALAPLLTPLGATAAVSAGGLIIVAILLLLARRRFKTLIPGKDAP
ncbi:MAG: hypothetical protein DI547_03485 [Sphingobium sp.]|nr:MAG: hypothetical protein DI547_03485 [Sphingobium sp.]